MGGQAIKVLSGTEIFFVKKIRKCKNDDFSPCSLKKICLKYSFRFLSGEKASI